MVPTTMGSPSYMGNADFGLGLHAHSNHANANDGTAWSNPNPRVMHNPGRRVSAASIKSYV